MQENVVKYQEEHPFDGEKTPNKLYLLERFVASMCL